MKTSPKHRSTLALATFASALLMLVVNDGLLKGQSVVPTWLSGKLSDFAGLIVAPVTLVLLARARRRSAQLCCLVAVAGLFTLTEVSPACAELAQALAARVGLAWRLWPDTSDLAALSVLPISWFCCRALSSTLGTRARVTRWLTLPASLACLASSGVNAFSARGYVYNATDATVFVEVSSAWLDCADFSAFGRAFLQPGDFVSLGLFELGAGAVLPLEPRSLGDSSELDSVFRDCMCPAMRVSTGGRTVNVHFESLPRVELVQKPSGGQLVRSRGQLLVLHAEPAPIEVGAQLGTFELETPGARPAEACAAPALAALDVAVPSGLGTDNVLRWSESSLRDLTLVARKPVAGNCFEVELDTALSGAMPAVDGGARVDMLGAPADAGPDAAPTAPTVTTTTLPERLDHARIHICAPLEMFPFQAGERVDLRWSDLSREPPYVEYLEIHNEQAAFKLMRGLFFAPRYDGQSPGAWDGYGVALPAVRCGPLRDAEGASFEAIDVTHAGQALVPGRAVRINRHEEIYLGRAHRYLGQGCGTDQSWLEVVERWTQ